MIKVIIFDFDGVLTKDATGTTSILNYFDEVLGINIKEFEKAYRKHNWNLLYGKATHTDIWQQVCDEMNQEIDIQVLYDSFIATPLDHAMFSLAKDLKEKGYVIGIITDNKKDRINIILEKMHLKDLFDFITISEDIGSGKKDKEIYETTIRDHKLKYSECLMIDNNEMNLIVPADKGMASIFYDHVKRDFQGFLNELEVLGIDIS